jgi:hypothetical protein
LGMLARQLMKRLLSTGMHKRSERVKTARELDA